MLINNSRDKVVSRDSIHRIPEEIIARRADTFNKFIDFLGGVICDEGGVSSGVSCFAGLQYLSLPKFVRRVIVAADNNANGTGQKFSSIAYWRFLKEGRFARYALPAGVGKDWNDVLRAESGLEAAS